MSLREAGWGLFLVGLPFAHFLSPAKQINQWYAQTFWAEAWISALFGLALMRGGMPAISNRPLGCWAIWLNLQTLRIWLSYLLKDWGHPIGLLSPLAHAWCVILFYVAAMRDWTEAFVTRLVRWIALAGVVLVAYGIVQWCNLDQFYKSNSNMMAMDGKDSLIGTIGNPSYYGIHLALLLPIFLWQPHRWWKFLAVLTSLVIILTGSTSALVCGAIAWLWYGYVRVPNRVVWGSLAVIVAGGMTWFILSHPFWLDPSGRLEAWSGFWQHYLVGDGKSQITGAGLGRIMADSHLSLPGWPKVGEDVFRHAHSEYFQAFIEQGVIGLVLIGWALADVMQRWMRLPKTSLAYSLGGIGLIFLAVACVNSPAHNWILGSFGLLAYCGVYALSSKQEMA